MAQLHQARFLAQLQDLHEQAGQRLEVTSTEVRDGVTAGLPLNLLPPGPLPSASPRPLNALPPAPALTLERADTCFSEDSTSFEAALTLPGDYAVTARYANGAGPINTDSRCALRALLVDGRRAGVLALPQRGEGAWDDWGRSSSVRVALTAGRHAFELAPDPLALNMESAPGRARASALVLRREP